MTNMKFLPGNNFYKSPVAYNGRTSSILPSKTDFPRPSGVYKNPTTGEAEYQPTRKLDYEMEMGIFVSSPHPFGKLLDADKAAADHIFGFVLLNDWSARDVQMYESIPVGPFNSKSFATSISPWVVVPEALQAAKTEPLNQTRESVPVHVRHKSLENTSYDILFDVYIAREYYCSYMYGGTTGLFDNNMRTYRLWKEKYQSLDFKLQALVLHPGPMCSAPCEFRLRTRNW